MKYAIIILSDPKTGSEEALGRLFNGLSLAYECKEKGKQASIYFQGTGTRWPEELLKESHPLHKLFAAVKDTVKGVSAGCAEVFTSNASGFDLVSENAVPGTKGLPSLVSLVEEGYQVFLF